MKIEDLLVITNENMIYPTFNQIGGFVNILTNQELIDFYKNCKLRDYVIKNKEICFLKEIITIESQEKLPLKLDNACDKYVVQDLKGNYAITNKRGIRMLTKDDKVFLFDTIFKKV